jgi:hypothetical protein
MIEPGKCYKKKNGDSYRIMETTMSDKILGLSTTFGFTRSGEPSHYGERVITDIDDIKEFEYETTKDIVIDKLREFGEKLIKQAEEL